MAQSSTLSHAASIVGSWIFAGCCMVGSVVYFNELKAVGRWALGVPAIDAAKERSVSGRTVVAEPGQQSTPAFAESSGGGTVVLHSDRSGHFYTSALVNGRSIDVLVDTGATSVALTAEDAERAGIFVRPSDFTHRASTANGMARIAPVNIDQISIGGITVRNVKGAVLEQGKLSSTLLGMTCLGRLSRAEMRRGTLLLEE